MGNLTSMRSLGSLGPPLVGLVNCKKKIVNCFLPTKHLRVHMNPFKRVRAFQIELEFGSVGF